MTTVVLNGSPDATSQAETVARLFDARHGGRDDPVRSFHLRGFALGHCLGDFDCWTRTPGRCRIPDAGQEIERAVHDADLLALVCPVTFGGYNAELKRALDRLIPLILPFFARKAGLTHHALRYTRLPRMIGIGVDATPSPARARLFAALVESNALNLGCPAWGAAVLSGDAEDWPAQMDTALKAQAVPGNATGSREATTDDLHAVLRHDAQAQGFAPAPKVAILIGSARPVAESTSWSLARYLASRLDAAGGSTRLIAATEFARGAAAAEAAARGLAEADIVVVAAPLYVDTLPALPTLALERLRALRQTQGARPARLVGLVNCGFPEPEQTRFAFAVLREAAREMGMVWAGGLAIGGGEAIHGRPLAETGGMTAALRRALEASAVALAQGGAVPHDAAVAAARAFLPPALYRMMGGFGQWWQARKTGLSLSDLRARPFDALSDADWQAAVGRAAVPSRPLRVLSKRSETPDTITLTFEDPARDPLTFAPGQYITLEAEIGGLPVRRAYSLSSVPADKVLAITVKHVPGGAMSTYLHEQVQPGDLIRSFGPAGDFGPGPTTPARLLLLIGGGAGIVPLAAIARHVLDQGAQVTLIHGAQRRENAIFADRLDDLARAYAQHLTYTLVLEKGPGEAPHGQLTPGVLARLLPVELSGIDRALVCGPEAMQEAARHALIAGGIDPARIVTEIFTSPRQADVAWQAQTANLLDATGGARAIPVAAGQSLLDAALDAGEAIAFSCLSGGCGACRVQIVEGAGTIVLDSPNTLSAAETSAGRVPACITRLTGPVTFRVAGASGRD